MTPERLAAMIRAYGNQTSAAMRREFPEYDVAHNERLKAGDTGLVASMEVFVAFAEAALAQTGEWQ